MNGSWSVSSGLELPDDIVVSVLSSSVISEKHLYCLSHCAAVTALKQYFINIRGKLDGTMAGNLQGQENETFPTLPEYLGHFVPRRKHFSLHLNNKRTRRAFIKPIIDSPVLKTQDIPDVMSSTRKEMPRPVSKPIGSKVRRKISRSFFVGNKHGHSINSNSLLIKFPARFSQDSRK